MAARAAVYSLIRDDPTLIGLGMQQVYAANAVDSPPEDFFIILKWENADRAFGDRRSDSMAVWAHDRNRDYGRIADALQRVEDLLTGSVHLVGEDGWILTQADWQGQGPDLYDGGYETCTRYSGFTIVSRKN